MKAIPNRPTSKCHFWPIAKILFVLASLLHDKGAGQEYSARGEIQVAIKGQASDAGEHRTYGFYLEVLDRSYKIRMEEPQDPAKYYEYAYADGLMHILHHAIGHGANDGGTKSTTRSSPTNWFPARVEEREIPPNDGTCVQYVWFALASHSYFAQRTKVLMVPIWSPEDPTTHKQPFEMSCFGKMLSNSPNLPEMMVFFNEGFYRSYNPATKALDVFELAAPYDKGYTNAIYQALSVTNTGNYSLPEKFIFAVYSSPVSAGIAPFERVVVKGNLKAVGNKAIEGANLKSFNGVASVADYRLGRESPELGRIREYNYVPYNVTNGAWPKTKPKVLAK